MMSSQVPADVDNQLRAFMQSGDLGRALQLSEHVLKTDPNHAQALLTFANVRFRQGLYPPAEAAAQRALESRPGDEEIEILLARISHALGHSQKGLDWCEKVLAKNPSATVALQIQANILERKGDSQGAMNALKAIGPYVQNPMIDWLTARCLLQEGDRQGALAAVEKGLALPGMNEPSNAAIHSRLLLQRARILDGLESYDAAIRDAEAAKKLVDVPFEQDAYIDNIDKIIATFTAEQLKAPDGYTGSEHPHLFIAGMPRSGTTLVEQILDAHPDATGVGEAKDIDVIARNLQTLLGSWSPWPNCATSMTSEDCQKLSAIYEKALIDQGFTAPSTFINKNLKNVPLTGLIAMLFPNAKFIFVRRDPRDVGVSCLLGSFSAQVHPELMDLDRIAMAIEQHDRLIEHWKSVLPMPWMEVQYEELIADQDRMTRQIVDFSGLPWDDRCLRFYDSGRTVMTLSYDQVNKPIYSTSAGRYKNYKSQIGPLMSLVKDGDN